MSRYRGRSKAKRNHKRGGRSKTISRSRMVSRRRTGGGVSFSRFGKSPGKVAPETTKSELETRIAEAAHRLQYILDQNQITQQKYHDRLRQFSRNNLDNPDYEALVQTQDLWHTIITNRLFWEAWDWMDVRALYILFMRGSMPSVPTHIAPLVLDSQTQKQQLERVNTMGFLTVDSQPGVCDENERQRAYVEGYLDSSVCNAARLYDVLKGSGSVLVTMIDSQGKISTNVTEVTRSWSRIAVKTSIKLLWGHPQKQNITAQVPTDTQLWQRDGTNMLPLTAERQVDGTWHLHTNMPFSHLLDQTSRNNVLQQMTKASPLLRENFAEPLVYVQLQHTQFCKSDLVDVLDRALRLV